jgi:mono/diheme cytochrome c family protein
MQSTYVYSGLTLFALVLGLACSGSVHAQVLGPPTKLPLQGGEAIYKGVCQDCHMPDARGGKVGPIGYPALAANPKLEVSGYPIAVVVHGQKAMPPFGPSLSDEQVADVVNYIRNHFGNDYKDSVTPNDVKGAR